MSGVSIKIDGSEEALDRRDEDRASGVLAAELHYRAADIVAECRADAEILRRAAVIVEEGAR